MKTKSIVILSVALLAVAALSYAWLKNTQHAQTLEESATNSLNALVAGNYGVVTSQFDESMAQSLPGETLSRTWSNFATSAGKFNRIREIHTGVSGPYQIATLRCEFERVVVDVRFSYNQKRKISGLWITPV